ncbi:putative protein isoform X1 [Gossypium australe]|uniref:Uncharacterized protein n=1 Tax=Gossypium australe TaxID=47621 RepID=A0A5B6U8X3_9ROSI|nr:putative protein isoform X1 [Gossypium australe]
MKRQKEENDNQSDNSWTPLSISAFNALIPVPRKTPIKQLSIRFPSSQPIRLQCFLFRDPSDHARKCLCYEWRSRLPMAFSEDMVDVFSSCTTSGTDYHREQSLTS